MNELDSFSEVEIKGKRSRKKLKDKEIEPSIFILYAFRTKFESILLAAGLISLIGYSVFPVLLYIEIGNMREIMSNYTSDSEFYSSERDISIRCYIYGVATVILGWFSVILFTKSGTSISLKWKKAYFELLVHKPMEWFDKNNAAEISGDIYYKCNLIENSLIEKMITLLTGIMVNITAWTVFLYTPSSSH